MRDFPRATIRQPSIERNLAYHMRQPVRPWALAPDEQSPHAIVGETRTVSASTIGAKTVEYLNVDEMSPMPPEIVDIVMKASAQIREVLAERTKASGRVVMHGEEPRYHIGVEVSIQGVIDTWPAIPGVTTEPYVLLTTVRLPRQYEEFRILMDQYDNGLITYFEVRLTMHPHGLRIMHKLGYADYFPHINTDLDMNPFDIKIEGRVA